MASGLSPYEEIYKHYSVEDIKYLTNNLHSRSYEILDQAPSESTELLNLVGPDKKFFIKVDLSFFHLLTETISQVLLHCSKDPNLLVVLDFNDKQGFFEHQLANVLQIYKYFLQVLNDKQIKYVEVNLIDPGGNHLVINNFSILDSNKGFSNIRDLQVMVDLFKERTDTPEQRKFRKVYLSRKNAPARPLPEDLEVPDYIDFKDDIRIYNEKLLEDYLQNLGFEIVHPEYFPTFEQQLEFMATVDVLASVTSAGLTNILFMPEGSTVIEFQGPQVSYTGRQNVFESLHILYVPMSFIKKHDHLVIPHMREAEKIIEHCESKNYIKNLLMLESR